MTKEHYIIGLSYAKECSRLFSSIKSYRNSYFKFHLIVYELKYHNVFHITEKNSSIPHFKDLELHTIELKKFSANGNEELSDK